MKLFKRKLYGALLQWKEQWQGKYAVLIEGARRVGKSTLAESFAKHEYKSYLLIDFSKASREVNALFEDMMDLDYFFIKLQSIFHVNLYPRESVIIFDAIRLNESHCTFNFSNASFFNIRESFVDCSCSKSGLIMLQNSMIVMGILSLAFL
jgi:AAA+ ATPase superfamily predicted ATPase